MMILGIDPGLHGGVAALGDRDLAVPMPTAGNEIDARSLAVIIMDLMPSVVIAEKVGAMPGQGLSSTFKFGKGYGTIIGICAAYQIRLELVTPQRWKGEVLAGTARDKQAAIDYCTRAFPHVSLIPPRCRVAQDGLADALCLAEYGRRTYRPAP